MEKVIGSKHILPFQTKGWKYYLLIEGGKQSLFLQYLPWKNFSCVQIVQAETVQYQCQLSRLWRSKAGEILKVKVEKTDWAFLNKSLKSALLDFGLDPCHRSEGADGSQVVWRQNVLLPGDAILHNAGWTISSQINRKHGYDKESSAIYKKYYWGQVCFWWGCSEIRCTNSCRCSISSSYTLKWIWNLCLFHGFIYRKELIWAAWYPPRLNESGVFEFKCLDRT